MSPSQDDPDQTPLRFRQVYYLAGFDTRSARFYHQLYESQAALQQPVNGCRYRVDAPYPSAPHATTWMIDAQCGEHRVQTRYSFLQWNDIVRDHWPASTLRVAATIPALYWRFATNGVLGQTWRLSRAFFWMLILPLLFALASAAAAIVGGTAAAWLAGAVGQAAHAGAAAIATFAAIFLAGLFHAERQRVFWLMRAWNFMLHWAGPGAAPLQQRWDEFAGQIDIDLQTQVADEVLIIGHSAGAMAAIAVAESWLARANGGARPAKVKLVTIGNATPILSTIPQAGWFREQIARVGASRMPWIDFTAPSDPLCHALVDPFTSCGLPLPARDSYRLKSARFDRMFDPAEYAPIRGDYFRIHFQYLMATRHPVENDYFQLTAGPQPLLVDASAR